MHEVEVRRCEDKDIPDVLDLLVQLGEVASTNVRLSVNQVRLAFGEMGRYPEIYYNLVACELDQIVGFMSVIFYKTPFHQGGTALINELIVSKDHRGTGIGKKLVIKAREEAVKRGMDELEVGTQKSNVAAQRFYKKCGFNQEYVLLGMEF